MKDAEEASKINVLGQTLELVWRSGPVKTLFPFSCLLLIFCFAFSFLINPYFPFIMFSILIIALILYLAVLLPKRPELFQDSKTWLSFQKMRYGDKQTGLKAISGDLKLYQPITETKSVSAKAKIIKAEVSQK